MSFSNHDYSYQHLPAWMRRDDEARLLERFLQWFGAELDAVDAAHDDFWQQINPETAREEFIDWWLWNLFGWAWFPAWFTLPLKRQFYGHIAQHLARRGTARGIELLLADFGAQAEVVKQPLVWGESYAGEAAYAVAGPLGLIVSIGPELPALDEDLAFVGEDYVGESYAATPSPQMGAADIEALLRWAWPNGNVLYVHYHPLGEVNPPDAFDGPASIVGGDMLIS